MVFRYSVSPMKPKRFFYHYNKAESRKQGCNVMTIHWEGACHMVNHVQMRVPYLESHAQKRQPHCIMRGHATSIIFDTQADGITAHINHHV
jgi:hypothetical protein